MLAAVMGVMSALALKGDIVLRLSDVSFGPRSGPVSEVARGPRDPLLFWELTLVFRHPAGAQ